MDWVQTTLFYPFHIHNYLVYLNHNAITNSQKVINYESQPIPKCGIVFIPMKKKKKKKRIEMYHSSIVSYEIIHF